MRKVVTILVRFGARLDLLNTDEDGDPQPRQDHTEFGVRAKAKRADVSDANFEFWSLLWQLYS